MVVAEKLPEAVISKYSRMKNRQTCKRKASPDNMCHKNAKKSKRVEKEEYIVEAIRDLQAVAGHSLFLIKWKGWPESSDTWEPAANLQNCPILLQHFLDNLAEKHRDKLQEVKEQLTGGGLLERAKLEALWNSSGHTKCKPASCLTLLLTLCTLPPEEEAWKPALEEAARSALQEQELSEARQRQLSSLREWEARINSVDPDAKLTITNDVDLEGPPPNFTYVNQNVPQEGIVIPEDPPMGCSCTSCNVRSQCSCASEGGLFAYNCKRRIRVAVGTPIYECNKLCKCPPDCTNRLVQSGRTVRLRIFRTSSGCGWGVRAGQRIPEGHFVCQYVGEIINCDEAERRARKDPEAPTYLFDLDFNSEDSMYTVDAATMGNVSHFINHSCEPNLGVWAVWGNCLDPNLPMLALFATREIALGEEISFDYAQTTPNTDESPDTAPAEGEPVTVEDLPELTNGEPQGMLTPTKQCPPPEVLRSPLKLRMDLSSINSISERVRPICKCGAKTCRKYLF